MSIRTGPVQRLFDLQRRYVEQSVESTKKGIEAHKKALEQIDSELSFKAYNRSIEAGKSVTNAYFDAIEEILPEEVEIDQQRELYDEAYEVFQQSNEEAAETFKQNLENAIEAYSETVEENVEILDEQIDLLLEELDEVEDQTIETVEKTKEAVEVEVEEK